MLIDVRASVTDASTGLPALTEIASALGLPVGAELRMPSITIH